MYINILLKERKTFLGILVIYNKNTVVISTTQNSKCSEMLYLRDTRFDGPLMKQA